MNGESNPYRAPGITSIPSQDVTVSGDRVVSRTWFVTWLAVYTYPVWLFLSFYIVWLIGWAELGHRPRPMLDDPKSIGLITSVVYFVPGLLLIAMPVLFCLGMVAAFNCPFAVTPKNRWLVGSSLLVFLFGDMRHRSVRPPL